MTALGAHSRDPLPRNDGLLFDNRILFRRPCESMSAAKCNFYPCTTDFAIMQWMPLEPFTVCVTRRSAARLQSV
jgi:hypothetical protein